METAMSRWSEVESMLRERSYSMIERDPQVLLEGDASFGVDADVLLARLVGMDGETLADWRISEVVPELYMPIGGSPSMAAPEEATSPSSRKAVFKLQSGHVIHTIPSIDGPPDVKPRPDFTVRVACLRYRRRL